MVEALAAQLYFAAWRKIPLKWKEDRKLPTADDCRVITQRESMIGALNRHATHPVNAILNYAYKVLETQVKIASVAAGLDPTIGYLHTCRPGRMALVYDLMEPLRPKVDCAVLDFVRSQTFIPQDFALTERGGCKLSSALCCYVLGFSIEGQIVQKTVEGLSRRLTSPANL